LAIIWKNVLHVDVVGTNENFFSLGGHSLRAIEFISELQREGIDIDIKTFYKNPTIKKLTNIIDKKYIDVDKKIIGGVPFTAIYDNLVTQSNHLIQNSELTLTMNAFNNTYFINAVNEVAKRYPQKDFCFIKNKKDKKL